MNRHTWARIVTAKWALLPRRHWWHAWIESPANYGRFPHWSEWHLWCDKSTLCPWCSAPEANNCSLRSAPNRPRTSWRRSMSPNTHCGECPNCSFPNPQTLRVECTHYFSQFSHWNKSRFYPNKDCQFRSLNRPWIAPFGDWVCAHSLLIQNMHCPCLCRTRQCKLWWFHCRQCSKACSVCVLQLERQWFSARIESVVGDMLDESFTWEFLFFSFNSFGMRHFFVLPLSRGSFFRDIDHFFSVFV